LDKFPEKAKIVYRRLEVRENYSDRLSDFEVAISIMEGVRKMRFQQLEYYINTETPKIGSSF
jgi:hypothetical protein